MSESTGDAPTHQPSAEMQAPGRLVGTWKVDDGAQGTVTYERMEGGFFLVQRVELEQDGQRTAGFDHDPHRLAGIQGWHPLSRRCHRGSWQDDAHGLLYQAPGRR